MVVTADATPPIVSNEPDPSGPTFAIEPAPSAPSSDISSDTGTVSSTDTGSVMPDASLPDPTVGVPSELPPILDVPSGLPPIEGTTGPADPPAPNVLGTPPNPTPGDPIGVPEDLGLGCRPLWCPHAHPTGPARRSRRGRGPIRSGPTRPTRGSPRRSSCRRRAWCRHNGMRRLPCRCSTGARPVSPAFDGGLGQWGFWYFGNWVPLFGPNASRRLIPKMQSHTPRRKLDDRSCGLHDSPVVSR